MNTKAVLKGRNDREQVQHFLSVVQTYSGLRSSHLQTNTSVQSSSRSASWIISPCHCESAHESRGQECEASCVFQASVVAAWLVATYAVMLTAVSQCFNLEMWAAVGFSASPSSKKKKKFFFLSLASLEFSLLNNDLGKEYNVNVFLFKPVLALIFFI